MEHKLYRMNSVCVNVKHLLSLSLYHECMKLRYIKIIVRKCKALQSLYKIELKVQDVTERRPRTYKILI